MRPRVVYRATALCVGLMLVFTHEPSAGTSQPYIARVLHNFTGVNGDGQMPQGRLIADATGALYGTTLNGGFDTGGSFGGGDGTVFKLTPPPAGQFSWAESVLFTFHFIPDGGEPEGGLAMDAGGALYGTTQYDYNYAYSEVFSNGTIFRLLPPGAGQTTWTHSVLYAFNGSTADGHSPNGDLIGDAHGNIYGTTSAGGNLACGGVAGGCGTVFELSPRAGGTWTEKIIHFFSGPDGAFPSSGLIADARGDLYGMTAAGGAGGPNALCPGSCGTVYKLTPTTAGHTAWTASVLHSFSGADGAGPSGNLLRDATGGLFGTTRLGGPIPATARGVVFKLAPPLPGQTAWRPSVLHAFNATPPSGIADGNTPTGLVAEGGHLYGTTAAGGSYGDGAYFMLTQPAPGQTAWTEFVLHSFNGVDAGEPLGPLYADGRGTLYGLSYSGGSYNNNNGTAFKLTHW